MKFVYLFLVLFTLSSCVKDATSGHEIKTTEVSGNSRANTEISSNTKQSELLVSLEYAAKNEETVSIQDSKTALEMCVRALTEYYKAVWNGSDIKLDTFIDNEYLKQYTQKKIQSQHDVYVKNNVIDKVNNIEIGAWEVEHTEDENGGFLYLKLPVQINKSVGGYGEITEFLVRNVNGRLVIVDWYTGAKDSYDFIVRGENETINNPNIWSDSKWVKKLDRETD